MGIVYLAENPSGLRVAVKLIRAELSDDPEFRVRFRREVDAGRRVGGICTAKYLDADLDCERPYLVTEYVEGGSLADYVAANGPLGEDQLVGMAVGLAEAIVAMHAAGVIHRDLKPSNVLMAADGPKVVDFGISHAVDGTALTRSGIIIGSPAWMAPEQATGRDTTPAVDVFAWGATVAFAATGRSPFGDGRPEGILYRVVHEEPDLNGVEAKLQPLVASALAKDPEARPTTDKLLVSVVRTAIPDSVLPGGNIAATTVILDHTWRLASKPTPLTQPARRRWLQIAWLSAIVLLTVGLVGGILYAVDRKPTHHVSGGKTTPKSIPSDKATTVPSTSTTATSAPISTTSNVSASIPFVTCPTSNALTQQSTPPALPTSIVLTVPEDLVSQIEVYGDDLGMMKLVGPRGWACSASYGADGSGGVAVYSVGEAVPSGQSYSPSSEQAIVGSETSACVGCAIGQACPLFPAAANADQSLNGTSCMQTRPTSESDEQISAGVVGFLDPPDVAGDGNPSGGPYPANGVMTYVYPASDDGSWLDTCTLPYSETQLCTLALNTFVQMYGNN